MKDGTCKGTIEEIRQFKRNQRKAEPEPEEPEETAAGQPDDNNEPDLPNDEPEAFTESEEPAEKPAQDDGEEPDEPEPVEPGGEEPVEEPTASTWDAKPVQPNRELTITVAAVPKRFTDPQKEANDWVISEQKKTLEGLLQYAEEQSRAYADTDKLVASQWNMRASALQVKILMLDEVLL